MGRGTIVLLVDALVVITHACGVFVLNHHFGSVAFTGPSSGYRCI